METVKMNFTKYTPSLKAAKIALYGMLILLLIIPFNACKKDDDSDDNMLMMTAMLSAPNQNGTNPDFVTDTFGIVPSTATGQFTATLDLDALQIKDITLTVTGMTMDDLKNFGPNSTPFHIHLPNSGNQGDFGFNVIDLVYETDMSNFSGTSDGFTFTRDFVSILEADQGNYASAGVHPGDDVIAERLQSGFPFIIIHSNKTIFTNTVGQLPNGDPVPAGFPFGELRGEISVQ